MIDEEKKFGKVENVEVEITKVSLNMNVRKPDCIDKITFETNKGNITIKPKIENSEFQNGFELKKIEPISIIQLPEIIKKIAEKTVKEKVCKTKVSYGTIETQNDGENVTYRFLTAISQFENWEIL